jgi:excisionase family DNA binding protein
MPEEPMTIAEQLESLKGVITLAALAELLGVSYKTVYKWARTSELPAQKIAGSYWVDPKLAARWWRNHATGYIPKSVKSVTTKRANRVA